MNEKLIHYIAGHFRNMVGTHEDIEDLEQEARIGIFLNPHENQGSVATYTIKDHIKKQRAKKRDSSKFFIDDYDDSKLTTGDVSDVLDSKLFYKQALSLLNDRDKYIVDSYCNNMSFEAIGHELDLSATRVYQLYTKAIKQIKKEIGNSYGN
jgi:RNA polymerase sigma factor (sigma-70 family)